MAKPLRSEDPAPQNMQFAHFGVLNDGNQSKASLYTSISLNIIIAIVVCIIGAAAKKTIDTRHKLTELSIAPLPKKIEPPSGPRSFLPSRSPRLRSSRSSRPRSRCRTSSSPTSPSRPTIKMVQQPPVVVPAPPKLVQPPPAPKVVNLAQAQPASVVNNSPHPTAVALGQHE